MNKNVMLLSFLFVIGGGSLLAHSCEQRVDQLQNVTYEDLFDDSDDELEDVNTDGSLMEIHINQSGNPIIVVLEKTVAPELLSTEIGR